MDVLAEQVFEDAEFKNLDHPAQAFRFKEFANCTFTKCNFNEAVFQECRFKDCAFSKCDLSMIRVKSCTFTQVTFDGCKLMGVNWTEASWAKGGFFRAIDFHDCALNYSSFFALKLKKMRLTECVAREVDFGEADLTEAVFTKTDFSGSTFMHTTLTGADFSGATNYTISPALNTLKKTKFSLPEAMSLLYSLDIVLVEPGETGK